MKHSEILDNALIIQYPDYTHGGKYVYDDISQFTKTNHIINIPDGTEADRYVGYRLNNHHFRNDFQYHIALPIIVEKLGIPYKESDFHWVHNIVDNFDCSYLAPNKEMQFEFTLNNKVYEGDYTLIAEGKQSMNNVCNTGYHQLFAGAHQICRIINKTINNKLKLFMSGDSHLIPLAPILACYFKEIIYVDNRWNPAPSPDYDVSYICSNAEFTHAIVECSGSENINKYFVKNLRGDVENFLYNKYDETTKIDYSQKIDYSNTDILNKIKEIDSLYAYSYQRKQAKQALMKQMLNNI